MSGYIRVICNLVIIWFLFSSFNHSLGNSDHVIATVAPINTSTISFAHVRIFNGTPYDSTLVSYRISKINDVSTLFYSCDVDYSRDLLYVFDARTASIEIITNIRPRGPVRELQSFHVGVSPTLFLKLAVDWISNNVYWVDPFHQWIAVQPATVSSNNQSSYRVLIDEELDYPTALAIDPMAGYLFWSNRRSSITIERSNLYGTNRQTLITRGLGLPISIAADFTASEIFWVDFMRDTIERSDYNGTNRKTIVRMSHTSFFDIALYQNSMIVSELDSNRMLFLNKITGNLDSSYVVENEKFYGVSMFSQLNQPSSGNHCETMGCDDMCIGGGTNAAKCACRTGYTLQADGKTCIEDEGVFYRAIVISDSTKICRLTIQVVSNNGFYKCWIGAASGVNDDVIKFLDVDSNTREFIYSTTYKIARVGVNGTGLRTLTTTTNAITGLCLDWTTGYVYWTSGNLDGKVNVLSLQGETTIVTTFYPRNILVDPHYKKLYWISGSSHTNVIESSNMSGEDKSTIVTSGQLDNPKSLVLDFQDRRLYWVDEGYVRRCSVDGTNVERIEFESRTAFTNPDLVLVYKEYLLWTEDLTFNSSQIHIVAKASPFSSVNRLEIPFIGQLNNLKVMDPVLQKRETSPCAILNGGCEHICLPVDQGRVCECEFGFQLDGNGQTCSSGKSFDNFILVTDWTHNAIYQVSLETGDVQGLKTESIGSPVGVLYDHIRNRVIWGETDGDLVRTFNLQTSETSILIETGYLYDVHPDRFAIDYTSGNIYYTAVPVGTRGFAGVAVLSKDGKHRQLVQNGQYPRAIVVDSKEGIMMWTDHGQEKVWKAYMDGSYKEELVVSPDLSLPNGIAIDRQEKYVYITDGQTNKIHKCPYMTSSACNLVHQDQDAWLMSIFLSADYLYYTSWNNPYITKIDKATFTDKDRLSNNPELGRLDDIFVYNSSEPVESDHRICSLNGGLGPCSTFCLPKGRNDYICACEDGVNLGHGGEKCENVRPSTTPVLSASTDLYSVNKSDSKTTIIIAVSAAGGCFIIILVGVFVLIFKRRTKRSVPGESPQRGMEMTDASGNVQSAIYDSIADDLMDSKTQERKGQNVRNTNEYLSQGNINSAFFGYEKLQNFPQRQHTNNRQDDVTGIGRVYTAATLQARHNQSTDSTNLRQMSQPTYETRIRGTNPPFNGDNSVDLSSDYVEPNARESAGDYLQPTTAFNSKAADYLTPFRY